MDLLKDNVKKIYLKYLAAAFGSAMISCIYGVVDMAVVGKYQGPSGTAALAVVAPVWNVIYSLGLLMGIGGSVLLSTARGNADKDGSENKYFTVAVFGALILAVLASVLIWVFERPILTFFGAENEELLSLAHEYLKPVKCVFPLFLFNQALAAFLRNDGAPALATFGVLAGGIFNVFGDIFFTFTLNMGIYGAGLATAIGSAISFAIMCVHFFSRKNTLKLVKVKEQIKVFRKITAAGFSTFFSDVAMGILTVLFNRQIMKYLSADALAVYGPIINVSTFVQCCAYSVGQAAQPIISANFGAKEKERIKAVLKLSVYTAAGFGLFWTALSCIVPNLYIHIFMTPTENILAVAPPMIRAYSLSFLLLPLNIYSAYYFQSLLKPGAAFVISVFRGLILSGILIIVLPIIKAELLWFSMPVTELFTSFFVIALIGKYTRKLF